MVTGHFAHCRADGTIVMVQRIRPPVDLTAAIAALPPGEQYVTLEGDPQATVISTQPDRFRRAGSNWVPVPAAAPSADRVEADRLLGKAAATFTNADLASALQLVLSRIKGQF